ncbi:MAG TPA: hypothetical protein DIT99_04430 [Candidatus Latescibacteria bacterium]|nr:hypothetical protein [Candidatus Latescibacterota bacterium]
MNDREKYLYDLQGFLVVRGLLAAEEIRALNDALDANLDKTSDPVPPGGLENTALEGDKSPYVHFSGMLTWDQPWCQPFRDLLAHKNILPYLNTMMGRGWKLDHDIDVLTSTPGAQGLPFHGNSTGMFAGSTYYMYDDGRMRSGLVVCQFYLTDVNDGDGGLTVIPGSHKANFAMPDYVRYYEDHPEIFHHISLKAGDLVIFNEATTHGALPWKGKNERRCVLHRYIPKYMHYAGGIYETRLPEWTEELTEAQRAVLEPPYIYGRSLIEDDGKTVVRPHREGF